MSPAAAAMLAGDGAAIPASAAQKGADATAADATAAMTNAEAGRSNYLSEEVLMGAPDPGAVDVALVLGTLAKAVA
jgi:dihydroxyacetone kinase